MTKLFPYGIVGCIILISGIIVGYIFTELPNIKTNIENIFYSKENPIVIKENTRILTPEETTTMSGSFQKDFQMILATRSGTQK